MQTEKSQGFIFELYSYKDKQISICSYEKLFYYLNY